MNETEETKEEIKRFLITDPCFIVIEDDYYIKIADRANQWKPRLKASFTGSPGGGGNYPTRRLDDPFQAEPESPLPMNVRCRKTNEIITIYMISTTMNGFGSQIFKDQEIQVESGFLCLAENKKGWEERTGAIFETLTEAKIAFPYILKNS